MDFDGSRAILEPLLVDARAAGWAPFEIDVLQELARTWSDAGRRDRALDHLNDARSLASGTEDSARAAEIAIARVWAADATVPRELREDWLLVAEDSRRHLDSPALKNRLAVERAYETLATNPAGAEAQMRAHLEALEDQGLIGTVHEIECLHTLARAIEDQGPSRAVDAEAAYLHALARAEVVYGAGHPDIAKVLGNAGIHAAANQKFELARIRMFEGLELRRAVLPPDHPYLSRSYTQIAGLELQMGNYGAAQAAAAEALRHQPERDRVYEIYEILGNIAYERGEFHEAIDWYEEALAACLEEREALDIHINVALALVQIGDRRAATERFDRYLLDFEATFDLPIQGNALCSLWVVRIGALDDGVERETTRIRALLPDSTCELSP